MSVEEAKLRDLARVMRVAAKGYRRLLEDEDDPEHGHVVDHSYLRGTIETYEECAGALERLLDGKEVDRG